MKKIFLLTCLFISFAFISCDPGDSLEANITNETSKDLFIEFVSSEFPEINRSLSVKTSETEVYLDIGKSGTRTNLLYFNDFDSIYVKNSSNEILKIFKENTTGKNIYNIDEYWSVSEPSKNHFIYTYEITEEDLK
ncbi:hypothetical protein [Tenacibaculum piscium]|uniref:hypothetical protein n=1 Tax=Tenacibaculum piscium TaxID=1458515 RepID=UPI001F3387C6|nr:hypothetical protein [Tenacibaculum piscium]